MLSNKAFRKYYGAELCSESSGENMRFNKIKEKADRKILYAY